MSFLNNLFKKKDQPIQSYSDFWDWFQKNEKVFYQVVKQQGNIHKDFFDKLSPRLRELKEGFFYLTGMLNDDTVELILTADGAIRNIAFVEELVNAAPKIEGWKFTALKPATDIKNVSIRMAGYEFRAENMSFYANDHAHIPDEIDITIVHDSFNEQNKADITNGVYIFLDNYLGELHFATIIDNLTILGKDQAQTELVPIEKLKDFLIWREKEFVEKYEGVRHDTEHDTYSAFEASLNNGLPLVAVMNTDMLKWDRKASHPWILNIEIKYDGEKNNGMPDKKTYELLDKIEDEILQELKNADGYLNVGRETAANVRNIYFACKDFRKPSTVLYKTQQEYHNGVDLSYEIYKDKYWQSFNRFTNN